MILSHPLSALLAEARICDLHREAAARRLVRDARATTAAPRPWTEVLRRFASLQVSPAHRHVAPVAAPSCC